VTERFEEYIPGKAQAEVAQRIQEAIRTKSPFELEHLVRRADGTIGWTHSRAVPLFDSRGELVEWFGTATGMTARRQAEEDLRAAVAEREALLHELHHRVKNNLQVITSLLEMQARQVDDRRVLSLFEEARNRVASIASIHELLYRSGSFSKIELLAYTRHLVPYLISFYRADHQITCSIEGAGIMVDLERAVPCGLLINELISNVCKHAFPNQERGNLILRLGQDAKYIPLMVRDTGIGLPDGFDYRESPTLGLQLVQTLVDQLGGAVSFNSERGTVVEVSIPLSHR